MLTAENYLPPDGDWEFDASVTKDFDAMLQNSIPSYFEMRRWTDTLLYHHFSQEKHPRIIDLGASRGEATARIIVDARLAKSDPKFLLIELSDPMRSVLHQRYAEDARVEIRNFDLRYQHKELGDFQPTCIVCVLTTIFTPIHYRQEILSSIYNALKPSHGTFLWVEKILGDVASGTNLLNDIYYDWKASNGYTQEAITRKRLALEFAQVPLTTAWCEDLLKQAGFTWWQKYWQSLCFAAWIARA